MESCCRACSRSDDFRRFSLYAVAEVSQEVIANMIRDTSDTQVSTEDGLPQHICPDCLMTLSLAYSFRKQCRRSEAKFREYWGRRTPAQSVDQQQQQHQHQQQQQQGQQHHLPRRSQSQVPDDSSFEAVATNIKEEVDIYDYEYSVPSVQDNQWVIQNPRTIGEGAMTVVHNTGGQYYDEVGAGGEPAGVPDREGNSMMHSMDDAPEIGESSGLGQKTGEKLKKNVPNPERYSQRIRRQIEPDVEYIETVPKFAKPATKPGYPYVRPPVPTREGLLLCSEKSKQMLESIVNNQSKMMENQQKMMQMIVDTISNVQYLTQSFKSAASASAIAAAASAGSSSGASVPVSFTSDIMSPVNSVEELNGLEELLKDDSVMQQYVARLSFVCGNSGRANGIDCCYKLIDHFITRPFLVQCSWTGNSRSSTAPENGTQEQFEMETGKVALKFYKRFRALFLNLIILADSSFNEMECENFFKRIMKNSKQRVLSKMTTSKHRNRPKNLKYNIQKHNTGTSSSSHASSMDVTEGSATEPFHVESIFSPFERPN